MTVSAFPDAPTDPSVSAPDPLAASDALAMVSPPADRDAFIAAQREAQKTVERAPLNEVPLSELQGLSLADQFYRVWGTEERGLALWEQWYRTMGQTGDAVLEPYAQSTAEELGISVNEARARIAVDKVLHDCGPQFAAKFMEKYYADQLQKTRTLQPMAPRRRKK